MEFTPTTVEARDGLSLNVWQRVPADADEAVLLVHGITAAARSLFGTVVNGDTSYSWIHGASDRGRATFALDIRGYGDSDVPPEMEEPAEENGPPVRADDAADDIEDTLAWLSEDYDTIHLVGVSWGSHTCGRYLERTDDPPVDSFMHCAPVYKPGYSFDTIYPILGVDDLDRAWITQDREQVKQRQPVPDHVFRATWDPQVESKQGLDEDTYKVQTGGLADWRDSTGGDPAWDPSGIEVPTMVFYGTDDDIADRPGSLECYDLLGTDQKEYVEMAGVDHFPMHGQRRQEFFQLVDDFHDCVV